MIRYLLICAIAIICLPACQKTVDVTTIEVDTTKGSPVSSHVSYQDYITFTIAKGEQYCDKNGAQTIQLDELKFSVKFDSSCIYKTVDPANQNDINKLYGFSDNNAFHHEFSARFGWRWSKDSLRLFGYIYNNSIRESKELGTIAIGAEQTCSIKVTKDSYLFTLNGKTQSMARKSPTLHAEGYKLYPYFGGDEVAPHVITISIKELNP